MISEGALTGVSVKRLSKVRNLEGRKTQQIKAALVGLLSASASLEAPGTIRLRFATRCRERQG